MPRILAKWPIIIGIASVLKILATFVSPPSGDLLRWSVEANNALQSLAAGRLPPVATTGPYGMMSAVLVPFYWLWTILPIDHPPVYVFFAQATASAYWLSAVMKVPIFLFDILTGRLVYRLVQQITGSHQNARIGFLAWYANPFNIVWLYVMGLFDVIPAAIVLLAVGFGRENKWFRSGLCTSIACLLRVYPLVTVPFFLIMVKSKGVRGYCALLSGLLLPITPWFFIQHATTGATVATVLNVPLSSYQLLDNLGMNIPGGAFARITPVLIILQFYVILRYWRTHTSIVHLATVSILAILLGAGPLGGGENHFVWVSPLLSICLALHPDELWIFILTFSTDVVCDYCGFVLNPLLGGAFWNWIPSSLVNPIVAGSFYAFKATYLAKLNLENMKG